MALIDLLKIVAGDSKAGSLIKSGAAGKVSANAGSLAANGGGFGNGGSLEIAGEIDAKTIAEKLIKGEKIDFAATLKAKLKADEKVEVSANLVEKKNESKAAIAREVSREVSREFSREVKAAGGVDVKNVGETSEKIAGNTSGKAELVLAKNADGARNTKSAENVKNSRDKKTSPVSDLIRAAIKPAETKDVVAEKVAVINAEKAAQKLVLDSEKAQTIAARAIAVKNEKGEIVLANAAKQAEKVAAADRAKVGEKVTEKVAENFDLLARKEKKKVDIETKILPQKKDEKFVLASNAAEVKKEVVKNIEKPVEKLAENELKPEPQKVVKVTENLTAKAPLILDVKENKKAEVLAAQEKPKIDIFQTIKKIVFDKSDKNQASAQKTARETPSPVRETKERKPEIAKNTEKVIITQKNIAENNAKKDIVLPTEKNLKNFADSVKISAPTFVNIMQKLAKNENINEVKAAPRIANVLINNTESKKETKLSQNSGNFSVEKARAAIAQIAREQKISKAVTIAETIKEIKEIASENNLLKLIEFAQKAMLNIQEVVLEGELNDEEVAIISAFDEFLEPENITLSDKIMKVLEKVVPKEEISMKTALNMAAIESKNIAKEKDIQTRSFKIKNDAAEVELKPAETVRKTIEKEPENTRAGSVFDAFVKEVPKEAIKISPLFDAMRQIKETEKMEKIVQKETPKQTQITPQREVLKETPTLASLIKSETRAKQENFIKQNEAIAAPQTAKETALINPIANDFAVRDYPRFEARSGEISQLNPPRERALNVSENEIEIAKEELANGGAISGESAAEKLEFKVASARESVRYFASRLAEAAQNYRPPITKITIAMRPENLGEVEITLTKRGERLIVQAKSREATLSLLSSRGAELKTSLSQSGFNDVQIFYAEESPQSENSDRKERERRERNRREGVSAIVGVESREDLETFPDLAALASSRNQNDFADL
ncbi:MAG: flagellar hook-length control protein FliK [Helicobacteraceae bacterium]|nr:flagellar hook-length control protein FliK [Helicobacteraceae bacterium]